MIDYDTPTPETQEQQDNLNRQAEIENAPIATPGLLSSTPPVEENKIADEDKEDPFKSEKPDYWSDDLWDDEKDQPKLEEVYKRLSIAEKRAEDLRRKVSVKNSAPEEYNFEELPEGLSPEDPALSSFKRAAKVAGLDNNQANKLVAEFYQATTMEQDRVRQEEIKKLGPDASGVLSSLDQFGKARLANNTFSQEEFQAYQTMISSAGAARVMSKILELTGEKPLPVSVHASSEQASINDIKAMMSAAIKNRDEAALQKAREMLKRYEQS